MCSGVCIARTRLLASASPNDEALLFDGGTVKVFMSSDGQCC